MKKVVTVNISGFCFTIEEDAHNKLSRYLDDYKASFTNKPEADEVMEDIESRIAEIFREQTPQPHQVVDMALVDKVILIMGMPEGAAGFEKNRTSGSPQEELRPKRFYRDPDHQVFGGVCSGLAAYFGLDIVIVRVLFLAALVAGSFGFWVYIILWIVTPKAVTIAQKLEMRGEPVTAENIWNYAKKKTSKK